MSKYFGKQNKRNSVFEMVGDKGVAEIVDFGVFNAGYAEVAFDCCSDIANQKRLAGFGYKNVIFRALRICPCLKMFVKRFFCRFVERNQTCLMFFVRTDVDAVAFYIRDSYIG